MLKTKSKTKPINKPKNRLGMSLVEVLVAMAIMSISMYAFMQIMAHQSKQTRGLEEVLARLDLEKTLSTHLADGSVCTTTLAARTFNATAATTTIFNVSSLPISALPGAATLIAENQKASSLSNSLNVGSINFKNLQASNFANKYNMDLEVAFTGGIRPQRPLLFKLILNTEDDASAVGVKKAVGCNSQGMTSGICASLDGDYNATTGKCTGVGGPSGMTADQCTALNGIYDALNKICTDAGVREYNGTVCPAPKQVVSYYWSSKTCQLKYMYIDASCSTAAGWYMSAPTCKYALLTCTANIITHVRCL